MSKAKLPKGEANKSLRSRVNFLQLAGAYLHDGNYTSNGGVEGSQLVHANSHEGKAEGVSKPNAEGTAMQRYLTSHMRTASQRSQVRLSQEVKHTFCKRCDLRLEALSTCNEYIENRSSQGRKPWADVKVIACKACGTQKRFPVGARRQTKKKHRARAEDSGLSKVAGKPKDGAGQE